MRVQRSPWLRRYHVAIGNDLLEHDSGYGDLRLPYVNVYLAPMASLESILTSSLCCIELQLGVL